MLIMLACIQQVFTADLPCDGPRVSSSELSPQRCNFLLGVENYMNEFSFAYSMISLFYKLCPTE